MQISLAAVPATGSTLQPRPIATPEEIMGTQVDFSTLLYSSRDLRLSDVFYEPNEAAQVQAFQDWLALFGCCGVVTVAMLEECHDAMLRAWDDGV